VSFLFVCLFSMKKLFLLSSIVFVLVTSDGTTQSSFVLVLLNVLIKVSNSREIVNFDFSWRHRLGEGGGGGGGGVDIPREASIEFDDSGWQLVDCPHDMLIAQPFDSNESEKQAFLPRNSGWYRKHFHVPEDWRNSSVWIYVEGSFHVTTAWLNGNLIESTPHKQGYTSFRLRLDTISNITYSSSESNVLALFVNASTGTGWWYEGGGLIRHQKIVRANHLHIAQDGVFVRSESIDIQNKKANLIVTIEIEDHRNNDDCENDNLVLSARVTLLNRENSIVETKVIHTTTSHVFDDVIFSLSDVSFWSVQDPYLYSIQVELLLENVDDSIDRVEIQNVGIRSIRFDADSGLFINERQVKLRGFCDHSNFGGIGAAVPDRVNLFRAQMLRSIGANSWRVRVVDAISLSLSLSLLPPMWHTYIHTHTYRWHIIHPFQVGLTSLIVWVCL